jgi:hypothetical protein
MKTRFVQMTGGMMLGLALTAACAAGDGTPHKVSSFHAGLFRPDGVDLIGYSVEERTHQGMYWYYAPGFPPSAAIGLSYHGDYRASGPFITGGIGIGSILYGSLGYQWPLGDNQYIRAGAVHDEHYLRRSRSGTGVQTQAGVSGGGSDRPAGMQYGPEPACRSD